MTVKDAKSSLSAGERAAVIRETFEAIAAVGFTKWKAEELALGNALTEEDRPSYVKELERIMWPDFQKIAANAPDDRLLDAREFWIDKANTMGLKEWQQVLSKGQGGQPFYEAIGWELNERLAGERSVMDELAEALRDYPSVLAEPKRTSVPSYPLPEPAPSPLEQTIDGRQLERTPRPDSAAAFSAMLRDYRGNTTWYFEEMDGTNHPDPIRTWPELSPEGKLGYLVRDAVFSGASPEHFVQAAREFLGELPPEAREAAALRLVLHSQRDLHGVARLLPSEDTGHDLFAPSRPLAERLQEFLDDLKPPQQERASVLGYKLPEPSPAPKQDRDIDRDR